MTTKAEMADSQERLWSQLQRVTNELLEANRRIAELTKGTNLETVETISPTGNPMGPKMVIGVVQCPKCGQYMEVEK